MKDDFITLACPSCGGKLKISQNTNSVICENCRTEHLVRREAGAVGLESYASCPICHRNDKSQKISTLPEKFIYPPRASSPISKGNPGCLIWAGIVSIIFSIFMFLVIYLPAAFSKSGTAKPSLGMILFWLFLGVIFYFGGKRNKNKNLLALESYKKDIDAWSERVDNWKRLYYCQRDDIVYDIETKKYCDPKDVYSKLLNV